MHKFSSIYILGLFVSLMAHAQKAIELSQGWTMSQKQDAYHLHEGSELIPLRWYLNLEVADSPTKLIDTASDHGLIPHHKASYDQEVNPYKLPLGMAAVHDPETAHLYNEKDWVGVNCSACHMGLIKVNGKEVLIEGGSSLFNIQTFEQSIIKSITATILYPDKFKRFAENLKTDNPDRLKSDLEKFKTEFSSWYERNHRFFDLNGIEIPYGPGRIDGLGGATNDLICHMSDRMGSDALKKNFTSSKNCETSHPPTSLPQLWGITHQDFVQWNGNVHPSLGRNFGQSTATYGKNWIELGKDGKVQYRSSAHIPNLYKLEKLYDDLQPPMWIDLVRNKLVSPLSSKRIEIGSQIFKNKCSSCHSEDPDVSSVNLFGNRYLQIKVIPLSEVKTDEAYSKRNDQRQAKHPPGSAAEARAQIIGNMIKGYFKREDVSYLQQLKLTNCRSLSLEQKIQGMKARSLEGVLFTAPYLHNGSVPTMWDLLQPASKRPKKFYLGCRKYDMQKMGYDCDSRPLTSKLIDTGLYGQSNKGHEYGTEDLSDEEKWSLIEYMKSLVSPTPPPKNDYCN